PPGAGDPSADVLAGDLDAGVGDGVQRHGGIGDPVGGGHFEVDQIARYGGLEVVRGVGGDDAAAIDDDDPVAERVGLIQVVGGQEHGGATLFAEGADVVPQVHPRLGVQTGGGLVQEHQVGVVDEAHRDVQAAPLPAGHLPRFALPHSGQIELFEQFLAAALHIGPGAAVEHAVVHQLLPGTGLGEGSAGLGDAADAAAHFHRMGC